MTIEENKTLTKFITDYLFVNNDDEVLQYILNKLDHKQLTNITTKIMQEGNIKVF